MTRRHFLEHMAAATALTMPTATMFANAMRANAAQLQARNKACILLFMNGGPPTIDIWDLKPGQPTGGEFKPISTSGDVQITEHLPMMSKLMHHCSIVRSMSTREADHTRGRYYMHTGYVPNPNVDYPSYGAVIAHEMERAGQSRYLEIPPFVSVGGGSQGPGFLGMSYAPFVVDSNGQVRNLDVSMDTGRLMDRMTMLSRLEKNFAGPSEKEVLRGEAAYDHGKVLQSTVNLMTSKQMQAFKVDQEPKALQERYGAVAAAGGGGGGMARNTAFGRSCLMARRLVESGVPFVEVDMGGWDLHDQVHSNLKTRQLPPLDQAMSALIEDLEQRGRLQDTTIVWMGDFGRTPRINGRAGRDHWARSWSCVVAGGAFKGGIAVGKTNADGTQVESDPYTSQDLMASVLKSMGVSLETVFTSKNNRPMKIANSGRVIKELFA
ncbi:MAG TPA: DUF1501 domain-containing protein [Pirellulales bacterium]|jgi:hypothetical protein|nr:DUF1501 domain-containing protein [Pirellulales bacterium]